MTALRGVTLAVLGMSAAAQSPPGPLTLDDCVRLALEAPSAVSAARYQAEIARYGVAQAKAGFLPQSSLGNAFTYNSPLNGEFSYIALNGVREYAFLANVGMDIDTSGKLRAQLARARADQIAAGAGLGLSQRDLRRAVSASYYRVLLARRVVQVTKESLDEAQAFEKRTGLLAAAGEAAQADVVKASAESASLAQQLNAATLDARLALHELAAFWTTDVDAPLDLADSLEGALPAPEGGAPAGAPYRGRLEFQLLDAQRQGLLADARRIRADLYPQLSLVGQYGIDSLRVTSRDLGYATFVHLNIPIFDFFKTRNAARQFDLQAKQAETQRQVAERQFSREYRDAQARVEMIYQQVALAAKQVKLSTENLRLSRVRYEGGEGLALDVVAAQAALTQARTSYYTARANYMNARTDLEVAAGK